MPGHDVTDRRQPVADAEEICRRKLLPLSCNLAISDGKLSAAKAPSQSGAAAAAHSEPLSGPKRRSRSLSWLHPQRRMDAEGRVGLIKAAIRPNKALVCVSPCKTCPLLSLEANSIDDERTTRNPADVRGIHNIVQRVLGLGSIYI